MFRTEFLLMLLTADEKCLYILILLEKILNWVRHSPTGHRQSAYLPVLDHCFHRYNWVGDAWPMWHQTHDHFPYCTASPPLDRYWITLLGDRSTRAWTIAHSYCAVAFWI